MTFEEYLKQEYKIYSKFAKIVQKILSKKIEKSKYISRPQTIQSRAKSPASLKEKLKTRGILDSNCIQLKIKDIAGVRVIFYTDDAVNSFLRSSLLQEIFEIHEEEIKVHYPVSNVLEKYRAIHYTVSLKSDMTCKLEYQKFKDMRCEIQIHTILHHAWSEMYHVLYKKSESDGFGSQALQKIEKRMHQIMDEYLLPAGYELQKAQYDFDRLMKGKNIFDRGALASLFNCKDNNERHDILSNIKEYVLPNYDDIDGIYVDLCNSLILAVNESKKTKVKPIETTFGEIKGKNSNDILKIVVSILNEYRYINVDKTFDCFVYFYKSSEDEKERKLIIEILENIVNYNIHVLKEIGYYPQIKVVEKIGNISLDEKLVLHPLITEIVGKLLNNEANGAKSLSFDTAEISKSTVVVNDELVSIRKKAIDILFILFDVVTQESDKIKIINEINRATFFPRGCNDSLRNLIFDNTKAIVDKIIYRIDKISYSLIQDIEYHLWHMYKNSKAMRSNKIFNNSRRIAKEVENIIIKFRELINKNDFYIKYKTLVGFKSVLLEFWEKDDYDVFVDRKAYALKLIDDINENNSEDWYTVIKKCAETQNNGDTFFIFDIFIREFALKKPDFAFDYISRQDKNVLKFLTPFLVGVYDSGDKRYPELVKNLIANTDFLVEIARHFNFIDNPSSELMIKLFERAVEINDSSACVQMLHLSIIKNKKSDHGINKILFIPILKYLIERKNSLWVNQAWYIQENICFFQSLTEDECDLLFQSLLISPDISYQHEKILTAIAEKQPIIVWDLLIARLKIRRENLNINYIAIPNNFSELHMQLAKYFDNAIDKIRIKYNPDDPFFKYHEAKLLNIVFPNLEKIFSEKLIFIAKSNKKDDLKFVIDILNTYNGALSIHKVIKTILDQVSEDDLLISDIENCLIPTGLFTGNFGMVEAYKSVKDAISLWISDPSEKVKKFGQKYIKKIEQNIAFEQRRAEHDLEARKRM